MSAVVPSSQANFTLGPTQDERLQPVKDRLKQGLAWRRKFEPTWVSNLAYSAGKHDLEWDRFARKLALPPELEGRTDLYVADVITEQRQAMLGDLRSAYQRPQMITVVDGASAESVAEQSNRVVRWGWEEEWHADSILADMGRKLMDFGTAAICPYFDSALGKPKMRQVPHRDGRPILDREEAIKYVADQQAQGQSADLRTINDGRICWKIGTPFNLIVPPGIAHERGFHWEAWAAPTPVDTIKALFGITVQEDTDIRSDVGITSETQRGAETAGLPGEDVRLKDHAWLFAYYERPTLRYRQGRVVWLATNQMTFLEEQPRLPHEAPDGSYRSGITYFHMWRRNDVFWSKSFIESLKDPQRMINRRKRQEIEIIDRGMPKAFIEEGALVKEPEGHPLEIIEMKKGSAKPDFWGGQGPGTWMSQSVIGHREDLAHASTLGSVRLGENPTNVNTYSQLALLNENEQSKRGDVIDEHQTAIREVVENSIELARLYWPDGKQMALAGDDRIDAFEYRKAMLPEQFMLRAASGSGKPRTLGAELQRIQDVAMYSVNSQQPLPVSWYAESLAAGEALTIPEPAVDDSMNVAYIENHRMLQGVPASVMNWDPPLTHIPIHRIAENQARLAGDINAVSLIEQHIQDHVLQAQANAATVQVAQQHPSPFGENAPPGPAGPAGGAPLGGGAPPAGQAALPGGPPAPAR